MTSALIQSTRRSALAGAWLCAAVAATVIAATALVIAATGRAPDMRRALGFGFGGVDRSLAEAASIAVHNARIACATLACAVAAPRLPRAARCAVDAVLASVLALNAGAVGVAYGAHGWRAIAATVPHLPVEFAGLSRAGGAYLHARIQAVRPAEFATVAAGCALLLSAAALLETYVSPAEGLS